MSLDINAIRERANQASPGPWRAVDLRHQKSGQIRIFPKAGGLILANVLASGDNPDADAEFIAHAREDVPALLDTLAAVEQDRDRLREQVAQYAPIAVPILADIKARKERAARMAAHTHYCWTCSDGTAPGDGCHNCRNTGMDQTPCVGCPGPQSAAEVVRHG